ncbi:GNAT family N-acetyltransferase [Sphingobium sp. HBC34]|uniref:GNAT family N-acetyltransferase n=1 Tax=Sphingobium cyanobacteriorum TaxID=3063954 RepID=A0ABT8ZLN0_9SPHN|nr:GNAT family N-acetyltransferase [Sphingobium sp. HBC34]MDO7835028.1 GNAT family N-acetyltransferase [Sphingobium sp. HBC34]
MRAPREYHSIDGVRQAMAGRLDRACAPLFDRLDWFAALRHHCFPDTPVRILCAQEDSREVWLFLLSPTPRRVSALANWYSFSWAPIFLGTPDEAAQQRLLDMAARHLLTTCAQIDLYPLEQAAPLLAALRHAGWFAVQRAMGGRHVLDVQGRSFADYWAARPGRLRNLVKRKGRGTPFALSISDRLTDDLWRDYVQVHARSWKEAEPASGLDFLHELAMRESAAGTLRLGFARADGHPVATQFWTVEGGVALIHKLSHDRGCDNGSPGTLLSHAMFAQAIDQDRVDRIDYGTGDNGYKTDWMERRIPLQRIDAFNPRCASAWLPAARTAISALVG